MAMQNGIAETGQNGSVNGGGRAGAATNGLESGAIAGAEAIGPVSGDIADAAANGPVSGTDAGTDADEWRRAETPLLELSDVKVSFAGDVGVTEVLAGVTLQAARGEFVAILGPSGSGKTTLFRLIGGLLAPDSGEIRLNGANLAGQRGRIGYMPQQPALLPWRRVLDNVALAAEVAGVPRARIEPVAREWLVRAGLGGYERAYPHELSGGMQQRASFVRALLGPQELLCLDEPFGALDALTRLEMQLWLASLWESSGRAVLLVTHSIDEALFLADRIYVLSNKPTTVLEELRVPWPRPRREELFAAPEFGRLRQQIYERMKGGAGA